MLWSVLGLQLATLPEGTTFGPLGGTPPHLTHIVFDEAQDISPTHIRVASLAMHRDGTITIAGDLRQRLSHEGYFENWDDLPLATCHNVRFGINYRQSAPIGSLMQQVHETLFDEPPGWDESDRDGPPPRVVACDDAEDLAEILANEARHWREVIPNATVGLLFDGGDWSELVAIAEEIEDHLQDTLTDLHVAIHEQRTACLNRTDCIILSTPLMTRGLEFDAVVAFDATGAWSLPPDRMSLLAKNRYYVSLSRAKQGLSIVHASSSPLLHAIERHVKS